MNSHQCQTPFQTSAVLLDIRSTLHFTFPQLGSSAATDDDELHNKVHQPTYNV